MKSKKSFIIGIVVIIAIAGTAAFLRRPSEPAPSTKPANPIQVGVRTVSDSRIAKLDLSLPGTVSAEGVASVTAATNGIIVSSGIRLGQKVGIGTVLARIDDPSGSVVSKSGFRNADIRNAELALENAKLSYSESKRHDTYAATHATELSKDLTKRNLESAQANLSALLDLHVVKSPLAGTVTGRNVSTGDSANAGDALFVIENGSAERIVTFYVSESERALLVPGQELTFSRTPNDPSPVKGTLKKVSSSADPTSRRFLAEASVTDRASVLPGTSVSVSAEATLNASAAKHIFLPLSSVAMESSGSSAIFIVEGTVVKRVPVGIIRIEGETAEVSADLPDDAMIVIENAKRIKDGDTVEVTSENR
ncbi:MAG: efflux RND transporter periplasmic adaptor subunit [Candidatus Moranbacteria bacterium]|nr:efflux RND transporter periplasmic adaptor subunit [Candidatus Moranbacteria bacterium]